MNIKVVGIGSAGIKILKHMKCLQVKDVDLIVATMDEQEYGQSCVPNKILLGTLTLRGEGTAMEASTGREAAIESFKEIKAILDGADIVIVVAGLGGGVGTGAAPIITKAAKDVGALTVAIVTNPFKFEGRKRTRLAKEGLEELKFESHSIIVIKLEKLLSIVEENLGIKDTFIMVDDSVCKELNSISKLIFLFREKRDRLDDADIKKVMQRRIFQNNSKATSIYKQYFFKGLELEKVTLIQLF